MNGYSSDSEGDPNLDAELRPRRGASIRARLVIANACGVRNMVGFPTMPSQRSVKKEDDSGVISVESFFEELEEDLKYTIKAETKPAIVKKLDDEPSLTTVAVSALDFGSPLSDAPSSLASAPASTLKRRREVFDCILLTSRKTTSKRRRTVSPEDSVLNVEDLEELDPVESSAEAEIIEGKTKKWKNDKIKKSEALCLLPETLRARIRPIGFDIQDQYITVDNVTRHHLVTREFMSNTYGGSPQGVEPKIAERHNHNMRDFFYLNTDYQPEAPEVPGAPGLWICTEPMPDKGVRRVITKIQDRKAEQNNKWLYVGQYEILAATPLTVEEWTAQSTSFHNKWADAVIKNGWGEGLRIRLHGRKRYNRDPTKAECDQIKRSRAFATITREDIKEAFFSGQERMGIWTMKCIAYDNAFQQQISEKFTPDWRPVTTEGHVRDKGEKIEQNG